MWIISRRDSCRLKCILFLWELGAFTESEGPLDGRYLKIMAHYRPRRVDSLRALSSFFFFSSASLPLASCMNVNYTQFRSDYALVVDLNLHKPNPVCWDVESSEFRTEHIL